MRYFASSRQPAIFVQIAQFHTTPTLAWRRRIRGSYFNRILADRPQPPTVPGGWIGFQASNALLDLDAYDSPYVRPYDNSDKAKLRRKWEANPGREELEEMYKASKTQMLQAHRQHARITNSEASGKWRVDDMDILTAALKPTHGFDDSLRNANSAGHRLLLTMRHNGIPQSNFGLEHTSLLEWLIWRQSEVATGVTPDVELVRSTLRGDDRPWDHERYHEWSRFFFWVLRMDGGIAVLNDLQDVIYETFVGICAVHVARLEFLTHLNNFSNRLEEAGFKLSLALTRLGLVLAADLGHPEAVARYKGDFERGPWAGGKDPQLEAVDMFRQALIRGRDNKLLVVDSIQSVSALMEKTSRRHRIPQPLKTPTPGSRKG